MLRPSRIRSYLFFMLLMLFCHQAFPAVQGVLPGKMRVYLYETGTGRENGGVNDIHASFGDTITVDVFVINTASEPVTGLGIYLTVDDRYFDIVSQGKNAKGGSLRPFIKGNYLVPAGDPDPFDPVGNYTHGDTLTARDNLLDGWQLDFVQLSGINPGGTRPISTMRYGTACKFQLIAKAPCDSSIIKLDSDHYNDRISSYFLAGSNDYFSFRSFQTCYITVTGIQISPPLPDILMASGTSNKTLDLDEHVGVSSVPDSLLFWTFTGNTRIGVSIDPKTHITTFTAPSDFKGFEDIIFTVGNGKGVSDSDTLRVTVDSTPILLRAAIPDTLRIHEDTLESMLHLPKIVEDTDDPFSNLKWFFKAANGKVIPSVAADSLFLKGIQDYFGIESLRLSVYDSFGVGDSLSVPVRVLPVNDPPSLKKLPDVRVERNKQYVLNMSDYASDVDGDILNVTWKPPEHLDISKNGMQIILKGAVGFLGSEKIYLTVSDPPGLSVSDSLTVTVVAAKDPPVWSRIPKIGFPQNRADSSLVLWDYVSDPDDGPALLTFVFANLDDVDSVYVNPRNGRTTFYDLDNTPGWDRVTVTAFDPDGNRASTQFPVFIGPADGTPIVAGIPDTTIVAGSQVQWIDLDEYYYDVDNTDNQMRWSWGRQAAADSSVTVSINPVTHIVYLRGLGAERIGMNRLFFTVTDPSNKFADDICIVSTVSLNRPMLDLPSKIGFIAGGKQELDLDDYVQDSVYPRTELSWAWSGNKNATITPETPDAFRTRPVTFSGPESWSGWERVVFEVKNPLGGSAQDTLLVFSVPADGTPVAGGLDVVYLKAGTGVYVNLDNYFFDADTPDHLMQWTVAGGDSVTCGIDPVNRTAYFNAPSESWEGQNTFTFTLTDPENHTATMRTTVVVTGAVIRNAFSVNIFRNPMQEDYMDVYIQSIVNLSASPSLSVRTSRDSTAVALETVAAGYYHGSYLLPLDLSVGAKGTAEVRVKGKAKDGKEVSAVKSFGYGRIDAGGGKIALSGFSLDIPPNALFQPKLVTVIPIGGESSPAKIARGGIQLTDERFSVGPGSLQLMKPMTVTFVLSGDISGAGIYRLEQDMPVYIGGVVSGRSISAPVSVSGTFALGYNRDIQGESALPFCLTVKQNMPNPFNPSTRIPFSLSLESEVTIEIFDAAGRKIASLVQGRFSAGNHAVVWEARDRRGRDVSSGTYFYRVSAGTQAVTRKMLFLR